MSVMVRVDGLTKRYGTKRGIADVSFQVDEGEVFGFLGPNGAGKTTTIRVLMALLRADSGTATIAGMNCWQDTVAINAITGYLPGELSLDPNLTGGQLLSYFAQLRGSVDPTYQRALIERLDFDPSRKFRQYSTGNKRKVGLIQAFMHRPRLLILDEPTSGLDPLHQREFEEMVQEVRAEGRTVLLSSHILGEVEHTCTRVGIIREGQMVRVGTVTELKDIKRYDVTMTFANPVSPEEFRNLDGVDTVEALPDSQMLRLSAHGPIDAIIKTAARYHLLALSSHEPTLEEIFLRYYTGNGGSEQEATNGVS